MPPPLAPFALPLSFRETSVRGSAAADARRAGSNASAVFHKALAHHVVHGGFDKRRRNRLVVSVAVAVVRDKRLVGLDIVRNSRTALTSTRNASACSMPRRNTIRKMAASRRRKTPTEEQGAVAVIQALLRANGTCLVRYPPGWHAYRLSVRLNGEHKHEQAGTHRCSGKRRALVRREIDKAG